jgi:hypothetical protein
MFCVPHIQVLSEQRYSTPQVCSVESYYVVGMTLLAHMFPRLLVEDGSEYYSVN